MFKWLNERLGGTPYFKAAEALRVEWEPLQRVPGVKPRLVDRLIRFVFTGEEEDAVAELAAMKKTSYATTTYYFSPPSATKKGLPALIKLLPEDANIYFRLATAYHAASHAGSISLTYSTVAIPALQGSLSWLSVFLNELSRKGTERDPIFPVSLLLEMIRVANQDEDVLVKAAFFYEDAQGKSLPQSARLTRSQPLSQMTTRSNRTKKFSKANYRQTVICIECLRKQTDIWKRSLKPVCRPAPAHIASGF